VGEEKIRISLIFFYLFSLIISSSQTAFLPGSLYRLQIKLYAAFNRKLNIFNSLLSDAAVFGGKGVLIRLENGSYLRDFSLEGLKVSAGFHTDIEVERVFKSSLPKPYSNCDVDEEDDDDAASSERSELFKLIVQNKYKYNRDLCFKMCFQK
jgi:hypothetical protein